MGALYHISDLHFSIGEDGRRTKDMTKFGPNWANWDNRIVNDWKNRITNSDVVLIGGDNAWPTSSYIPSMKWIGSLPGTKYMIDGNHCKYVNKGIGANGAEAFKKEFFDQTGINYIGYSFVRVNNTGIIGCKLCDLETNTFYSRYKLGTFQNEFHHLRNIVDASINDMLECKNRIVLAHYPLVDDKLDYENSDWLHELTRINPTHCLYGHYHGPEVKNHLPSLEMEWNGIKFLNTSMDLHDFKMRKVLDEV